MNKIEKRFFQTRYIKEENTRLYEAVSDLQCEFANKLFAFYE